VIFVLIGLLAVVLSVTWQSRAVREIVQRRPGQALFWGLLCVVIILVSFRTGRHWLALAATAVLVWGPRLLPWLGLLRRAGVPPGARGFSDPPRAGRMTRDEALEVLGLDEGATKEQILARYRALMKSVHPDSGGSGYLAKRVNEAKRVLIDARGS
jgi:hypothetical protein